MCSLIDQSNANAGWRCHNHWARYAVSGLFCSMHACRNPFACGQLGARLSTAVEGCVTFRDRAITKLPSKLNTMNFISIHASITKHHSCCGNAIAKTTDELSLCICKSPTRTNQQGGSREVLTRTAHRRPVCSRLALFVPIVQCVLSIYDRLTILVVHCSRE